MWTRKDIQEFKTQVRKEGADTIMKVGHGETVTVSFNFHDLSCYFPEDSFVLSFIFIIINEIIVFSNFIIFISNFTRYAYLHTREDRVCFGNSLLIITILVSVFILNGKNRQPKKFQFIFLKQKMKTAMI